MQDQPTNSQGRRAFGFIGKIAAGTVIVIVTLWLLLAACVASADAAVGIDAFGKRAWSNARLTTNMKLANAQISLHDRILNRQAAIVRAAREDARSALWIANQTYEDSVGWTLTLVECIREPEGQEEACLDAALSSELLPEPYAESYE